MIANLFNNNNILVVAEWTVLIVLTFTVLMAFMVLIVRVINISRMKSEGRLMDKWEPLLIRTMAGEPATLPRVKRWESKTLLNLWNNYHDIQLGESVADLNRFAEITGLDTVAWRMLHHGNMKNQLAAIVALGNLRLRRAWPKLRVLAENDHPILSLAAARAMAKIEPKKAVVSLIPMVVKRTDWPDGIVINILFQMGKDVISAPLAKAVLKAPAERAPRLIGFFTAANYETIKHVIYRTLAVTPDDQVISACLKVIKDADNLDMVRKHLSHPTWFVRVQAVKLLGKTGMWEDEQRLINMLADQNWWVRYRTAQTLAAMPSMGKIKLTRIIEGHWDRYAKDIVKHVMAERQMA